MDANQSTFSSDSDNDDDTDNEESFHIWDESSDEEEASSMDQERIAETLKQYATHFKVKLDSSKNMRNVNPLIPPPMIDEGKRDQKTMRIENYFGDKSRLEFFDRSNWMRDKRNVMNTGDDIADKVIMSPKLDYSIDYAFSPRRCDDEKGDSDEKEDSDEEVDSGEEDDTAATTCSVSTIASGSTLHTTCTSIERGRPTSPRSRYIGNCINSKINPRLSLILRKRVSTELNLKHQVKSDVSQLHITC